MYNMHFQLFPMSEFLLRMSLSSGAGGVGISVKARALELESSRLFDHTIAKLWTSQRR